jgi:hypothetical protein
MTPPGKVSLPLTSGAQMRRIAFMMILIAVCVEGQAFDKRANILSYELSSIHEELQRTRLDINDAFRSAVKNLIKN